MKKIRRMATCLMLAAVLAGILPLAASAATYSDVPESYWAYDQINTLVFNGVVGGYPDGAFRPDGTLIRAEWAKMLVIASGLGQIDVNDYNANQGVQYISEFVDIQANQWYTNYMVTLRPYLDYEQLWYVKTYSEVFGMDDDGVPTGFYEYKSEVMSDADYKARVPQYPDFGEYIEAYETYHEANERYKEDYLVIKKEREELGYDDSNINGISHYWPEKAATRQSVVYSIVKVLDYDTSTANLSVLDQFSDRASIDDMYKPYVALAVEKGLISGYPNGTFGGGNALTRAEAAVILCRAFYGDSIVRSQSGEATHAASVIDSLTPRPAGSVSNYTDLYSFMQHGNEFYYVNDNFPDRSLFRMNLLSKEKATVRNASENHGTAMYNTTNYTQYLIYNYDEDSVAGLWASYVQVQLPIYSYNNGNSVEYPQITGTVSKLLGITHGGALMAVNKKGELYYATPKGSSIVGYSKKIEGFDEGTEIRSMIAIAEDMGDRLRVHLYYATSNGLYYGTAGSDVRKVVSHSDAVASGVTENGYYYFMDGTFVKADLDGNERYRLSIDNIQTSEVIAWNKMYHTLYVSSNEDIVFCDQTTNKLIMVSIK